MLRYTMYREPHHEGANMRVEPQSPAHRGSGWPRPVAARQGDPAGAHARGLDAPPGRGPVQCKFSREVCNVPGRNMSDPRDARDRADGRSAVRDASRSRGKTGPHPIADGATRSFRFGATSSTQIIANRRQLLSTVPNLNLKLHHDGLYNFLQGPRPNHRRFRRALSDVPRQTTRRSSSNAPRAS